MNDCVTALRQSARARMRIILAICAAFIAALTAMSDARAHQTVNGVWTYRYFTRNDDGAAWANCNNDWDPNVWIDPLNIINYRWGEWSRMNLHYEWETDWGWTDLGGPQVTCITTDGQNYSPNGQSDQQGGHGTGSRAHFRLFAAGHVHPDVEFKWSVLDVHHEACCAHDPDEDWETWESHIGFEIWNNHEVYWDEYFRRGAGPWRGLWDSGSVTRVGGLHNGAYN